MTPTENKRFMSYMERFSTIKAAGMLDAILGDPKHVEELITQTAEQLELF